MFYEKTALYAKKTGALAYHKIDLAILQFFNTTGYCRKIILACFIYKKTFQQMQHVYYCNNYIYKYISQETILVFQLKKVIAKMSMKFDQTKELEKNQVEKKYV